MANRLAELRKQKKLTLDQMQEQTGINRVTISQYERGKREPKLETWQKLADFFKVPVDYLQGLSNDRDGWHLWEEATGYSRSAIEFQIQKLIDAKKLSETDDIQKQIGLACKYLDGRGITDRNAVMYTRKALSEISYRVHDDYYIDPKKKNKYGKKLGKMNISTSKDYDGSMYYDDMDKEVYKKISSILEKARHELADYLNEHDFKN